MRKIVKVEELEMVGAGATLQEWIAHNPGKPYKDLGFSTVTYNTQYGTASYKVHNVNVQEWYSTETYSGQTVMQYGWHVIDILPMYA